MKNLLIVESPTKSRTLTQFLGKDFVVEATVGHVKDLPKSTLGVNVDNDFRPDYKLVPTKEKVVKKIADDAKRAEKVYLATDPDREGEAISQHIYEELRRRAKVTKSKVKRIVFHEITKSAVEDAMKHPREIDVHLVDAQMARRSLDRLVGYKLSPLLWKKVRYGLSAGRVQSAALRIVMERERLIRAFVPEEYFVISGQFAAKDMEFPLVCDEEPKKKSEADEIVEKAKKGKWEIVSLTERETKRHPYPPFITSTLQRVASNRLGFSPSRTMRAAQRLYEAGHITYMRTDSPVISKEAQGAILSLVEREYGKKYAHPRNYKAKIKNAQEAHEAIRPTDVQSLSKVQNSNLSVDEKNLYKLIWERAVASQMASAIVKRTKLSANIETGDIPNFSTNGVRVLFDGWLKVNTRARGEETEVPNLVKGDPLTLKDIKREDKETQPPSRYTEAGLIKELEKRGIGRPSTYATITKTIIDRGYIEKDGKTLIPTDTGDVVSTFLEKHFSDYISDNFTSEMENDLDKVAAGELRYEKLLKNFYKQFEKDVEAKENVPKLTNLGKADSRHKCPKCGKEMIIKLGRNGKFLSCSNYPECDGALTLDGKEIGEGEVIGNHPETGEIIYLLDGRYGYYVQLGKKTDDNPNPKRASVPRGKNPHDITVAEAVRLLALPRELGKHPESGDMVIANIGRYGPYVGHGRVFRSLKKPDDPYTVTFERALEVLGAPKALPKGVSLVKELGKHPKSGKMIRLLKSKSGLFVQKGMKRLYFDTEDSDQITLDDAVKMLE